MGRLLCLFNGERIVALSLPSWTQERLGKHSAWWLITTVTSSQNRKKEKKKGSYYYSCSLGAEINFEGIFMLQINLHFIDLPVLPWLRVWNLT